MSVVTRTATRVATVTEFESASCDRCRAALEPVFNDGDPKMRQFHDGLIVRLDGYYGGFIDMESHDLDLCESCARAMFAFLGLPAPE